MCFCMCICGIFSERDWISSRIRSRTAAAGGRSTPTWPPRADPRAKCPRCDGQLDLQPLQHKNITAEFHHVLFHQLKTPKTPRDNVFIYTVTTEFENETGGHFV